MKIKRVFRFVPISELNVGDEVWYFNFKNAFKVIEKFERSVRIQNVKSNEILKVEGKLKMLVCPKCNDKGWYYVAEFIGKLQGMKDCSCKG